MVLLVSTVYGVTPTEVADLLESSGRCRWRPLSPLISSEGSTLWTEKFGLMGFDFNFENHNLFHKKINKTKILVIPVRPDLVWDRMEARYGEKAASAYCNRMRRLQELSCLNSLTIPYEDLSQGSSLLALQNFLGFSKPFVAHNFPVIPSPVDCAMHRRYLKYLEKMTGKNSWYLKYTGPIEQLDKYDEHNTTMAW